MTFKPSRKVLLILLGLVAVTVMVVANLRRGAETKHKVEVEKVARRNLEAVVSGSGWIEPRRKVDVSANTPGRVVELAVDEGDTVAIGQVLLRIDPTPFRGQVDRLRAGVSAARADLESAIATDAEARTELERIEALDKRRLASATQVEAARRRAERATAGVAAARSRLRQEQATLRTAEYDLSQVTISAAMAGVITRLNIEEGETVVTGTMNNPGTILLTIADLSVMEAEIEVDETDVVDVRLGQNVKVTVDAFPDTVLNALVTEVGSSARRDFANPGETSADFPVVVRLTETLPGLRPGLSATAEIVTARRSDVLSVSIGALGYRDPRAEARNFERRGRRDRGSAHADEDDDDDVGDENEDDDTSANGDTLGSSPRRRETYGLFLAENGRARFVPVMVGISGERHIEITAGVPEGAEVVAGPFQVLREVRSGDRLKPESRKKLSQKKK